MTLRWALRRPPWAVAVLAAVAVAALLPILARPAEATSAVRFVSPSGSDSSAGTVSSPWRTIGHALARLGPGDTLVVADGEYRERIGGKGSGFLRLTPGTPTRPVTVVAAAGATPTIRGLLWIQGMDHWTIDGLNVTWDGATGRDDEHMVRLKNGVGWTYANSEIWGARSFANVNVLSDTPGEPADWTLRGNCVHSNWGHPDHGRARDQLLYIHTGLTAGRGLIERNILFNAPRGKAVKLAGHSLGTGTTNVTVRYNTIVDTYKPPINVAWETRSSVIHHNLVGDTGEPRKGLVRGYQLHGSGITARDNHGFGASTFVHVDAASTSTIADRANVLSSDPAFDSRTCDGFRPGDPAAQAYGRWAGVGDPSSGGFDRVGAHGPHGFVDVAPTAFYDKPVGWAKATGITTGVGGSNRFAPDDVVTRAELVTFLWRLAGRPTGHPAHGFVDVAPTAFYEHPVRWAKATGVTTGIGGSNTFAPGDTVTRGQAVTFLWRAIEEPGGHPAHGFVDIAPGAFYEAPVRWARVSGVTTGIGGTDRFAPDDGVTRGQAVTFLWRAAGRP